MHRHCNQLSRQRKRNIGGDIDDCSRTTASAYRRYGDRWKRPGDRFVYRARYYWRFDYHQLYGDI
jgi:hypothetical protein